jgi:hypothetical protein
VSLEEGHVQLRDDRVLVIARIADQRGAIVEVVGAPRLTRDVILVAFPPRETQRAEAASSAGRSH